MKVLYVKEALNRMREINDEIRYKSCVESKRFSTGLISFKPRKKRDSKQIVHPNKDVVCHVLRGRGRLKVNGRRVSLAPGMICHIPKGTRHDFAAGRKELILFYSLIKTG